MRGTADDGVGGGGQGVEHVEAHQLAGRGLDDGSEDIVHHLLVHFACSTHTHTHYSYNNNNNNNNNSSSSGSSSSSSSNNNNDNMMIITIITMSVFLERLSV